MRGVITNLVLLLAAQASPQIGTLPLPTATLDVQYCDPAVIRFEARGGFEPYSWSVDATTPLPPGFSLSVDGRLCGIAERVGSTTVIIRVDDANGGFDTNAFVLDVEGVEHRIATFLLVGAAGQPFDEALSSIRGTEPVTWRAIETSPLPDGLSVTTDGRLVGTTEASGWFPLGVVATDARGDETQQAIAIDVRPRPGGPRDGGVRVDDAGTSTASPNPTLSLDRDTGGCGCTTRPPTGSRGVPWLAMLAIVGLALRRRWIVPVVTAWVVLAPAAAEAQTVRIESGELPAATVGVAYEAQLGLQRAEPGAWILELGLLPAGLVLEPDGRIVGTPEQVGRFRLVVQFRANDPSAGRDSDLFELIVRDDGTLRLETNRLPVGQVGAGYDGSTGVEGGVAPYRFEIVSGRTPEGIVASVDAASSRFRFVGQPSAAEFQALLVVAIDAHGRRAIRPYIIVVEE